MLEATDIAPIVFWSLTGSPRVQPFDDGLALTEPIDLTAIIRASVADDQTV